MSTQQLYAGSLRLMADKRPQQLPMPAGILGRAMLEGVGNFFLYLQGPAAWTPRFLRDCYLNEARRMVHYARRHPDGPAMLSQKSKLAQFAAALGLTPDEAENPPKSFEWPLPGALLGLGRYKRAGALLVGQRYEVFDHLYQFWYSQLSTLAHHRVAALQAAVYTEEQPDEETFLMLKTAIASLAIVSVLCVLSEIEHGAAIEPCVPLRVAWENLRTLHDLIQDVFTARYQTLLSFP